MAEEIKHSNEQHNDGLPRHHQAEDEDQEEIEKKRINRGRKRKIKGKRFEDERGERRYVHLEGEKRGKKKKEKGEEKRQ